MIPVMRTRSPAFKDSTSASLSGGVTSLNPSDAVVITASLACAYARDRPRRGAPPPFRTSPREIAPARPSLERGCSQRHFLVPVRVTFYRDCYGQARDVARIREDVDAKSRGVAAVALGPDAEPAGAHEDFLLDRVQHRVGIWRSELAEERPLRQDGSLLEVAP